MKLLQALFGPCLICAAVLLVFGQVAGFSFVNMDDPIYIYENPAMQHVSAEKLVMFWKESYHALYTPLAYTVWGAAAATSGDGTPHPLPFHLLNLGLHLISSLLVFAILMVIARDRIAATVGGVFWAVHPAQTEVIAWVGVMKDGLFVCLGLVAILLQLLSWNDSKTRKPVRRWMPVGAWIAFVLSLLSKPTAAIIPLVLLTLAVGVLAMRWRPVVKSLWFWFLTALPFGLGFVENQPDHLIDTVVPWNSRFLIATDALAFYFRHLILPSPLSLDYGRSPRFILSENIAYLSCILMILIPVVLWAARSKTGRLPLGLYALFVAALSPVLGFKQFTFQEISTVADRYLYLPLLAPALALALGLSILRRWREGRAFFPAVSLASMACLGFSLVARAYVPVWNDTETLMEHVIETNPKSFVAIHNLGKAKEDSGDLVTAEKLYRQSIALHPMAENFHGLGAVLLKTGRYAESVDAHLSAVELAPLRPHLHVNLAVALVKIGRIQEAKSALRKALELDPTNAVARENLRRLGEISPDQK